MSYVTLPLVGLLVFTLVFCGTAVLLWRSWTIRTKLRATFRCADCEGWNNLFGGAYWALRPTWPCYGTVVNKDGPICKFFMLRGSLATRRLRHRRAMRRLGSMS